MVSALVLVLSMLALGYLFRRLDRLPENAADVLNRIVIDVCVPAAILRLVPKLTLDRGLVALVIVPWVMVALAYLLARALARLLRLDDRTRTAVFLSSGLGNTSFLGFPLCGAVLGEASIPLAAVYDQLGSFLILSSVVPVVIGRATAAPGGGVAAIARKVLLFPPFVSLLVALLPLPMPAWLDPVLAAPATALVPLAMFAVGLRLRFSPPRPVRALAAGLAVKLVILPAAAWLVARALGAPPFILKVAVVESAMPTMITAGAILMASNIAPDLAAAFVSWGLLIALVTVPLWSLLLR